MQFLADGVTPVAIGDPSSLAIAFGAKLAGQYGAGYLAFADDWIMAELTDTNPTYFCTPSFNTAELNAEIGIGDAENAEIVLMAEITWSDGSAPTSTKTFVAIVENDVNRGTEGTPSSAPTPDDWLAARLFLYSETPFVAAYNFSTASTNILRMRGRNETMPTNVAADSLRVTTLPVWANTIGMEFAIYARPSLLGHDFPVWVMRDPTDITKLWVQGNPTTDYDSRVTAPWEHAFERRYNTSTHAFLAATTPSTVTPYQMEVSVANWDLKPSHSEVVHTTGAETVSGQKSFTSPIVISLGTASTPGLCFAGDSNTGLFSAGADNATLTAGGVDIMQFNASGACVNNGIMRVQTAGTLTWLAYCRAGDENTGLYFPAADQLGLVAGGVQQLLITTSSATFTSQVELPTAQAATNGKSAMSRDLDLSEFVMNLGRMRRSDVGLYAANGGTASQNDGDYLVPGLVANARPLAYRFRHLTTSNPMSGLVNSVVPMRIGSQGVIIHPGSTANGARLRCGIGIDTNTCPAADANALSGAGFGWEIYWNGSNLVIGLFAHNGTTYVTTDGLSGRSSAVTTGLNVAGNNNYFHVVVGLSAAGLVSAWGTFGSTGAASRPSATPLVTLAGGPTTGQFGGTGYTTWAMVNHSTNAPSVTALAKILDRIVILD